MNKIKIFTEEKLYNEEFDKIPFKQLKKMVGWIEPNDNKGEIVWDVTMADGGGFECQNQETAQIISELEEIKALLIKQLKKDTLMPILTIRNRRHKDNEKI